MKIDQKKLARQELCFNKWRLAGAIGAILAVTGFGKTFILIMALRRMNKKFPDRTAIILVPNTNLLDDWTRKVPIKDDDGNIVKDVGHLKKWNLINVKVFVINTYVRYVDWEADLFAVDEVHRILNEDAQQFSKALEITTYKYIMVMSATISPRQEEFLNRFNIKVVDRVTEEEAQREGFISPAITYNLGITLSLEDTKFNEKVNKDFNYYFAKFDHQFDFIKAVNANAGSYISVKTRKGDYLGKKRKEEWIKYIATKNKFNGDPAHPFSPSNISKYAAQAMRLIKIRKTHWQNHEAKIPIAVKLIKLVNKKTIVFTESSEIADKLTEALGDIAMAYHTKLNSVGSKKGSIIQIEPDVEDKHAMKRELKAKGYEIISKNKRKELAKSEFNDPNSKIKVLVTVRALDEGADFKTVDFVLFVAYNSTGRQRIQREGRGRRIDYTNASKKTLIVYLYMKGTQEEKWLITAQKGKRTARWIDSINSINLNESLKLGNDGRKEIKESEIEIVRHNK